jgi:hypothetical protein
MRVCAVLSVLCAAALAAPPAAAQTVDELVSRHIEARGGYDKIKAIQTIKITRTVATPFNDVRVIIYKKRPQLFRAEQGPATPGAPLTPRGVNADAAWDTVQGGKIATRPEAAAAEARDLDGDFDGLLVDWKQKGHTVSYEGRESLPAGETYKLKVKTRSGAERVIYLDANTYLERRQTGILNLPPNRQFNIVLDFGNYRDVNGVKFAYDINEDRTGKEPSLSFVTYTEAIEVNVPLEDSLFATPNKGGA